MTSTNSTLSNALNVRRGLLAAAGWALMGAVLAVVGAALLDPYAERLWPVVGCAVVLGCSGWAAYAPQKPRSIALALVLIFTSSAVVWTSINAMEVLPRRLKGVTHPPIYFGEAVYLIAPPVLTAILLAQIWRERGDPNLTNNSSG
jgi:hypothetical protein